MEKKIESTTKDEISLRELIIKVKELLRYVIKRWYILIVLGGIGYLIGFLYESRKPILYTATTTFILESANSKPSGGNLSSLGALLGVGVGDNSSNLFQGKSLIELYKSRTILQEVLLSPMENDTSTLLIQKLFLINEDLYKNLSEKNSNKIADIKFLLSPDINEQRLRDSIIAGAVGVVKAQYFSVGLPSSGGGIVKVDVNAEDEVFAKSFNHYLVDKVNELYMEIKAGKSYETVKILQHKVDSARQVMLTAISRGASAKDQTPNLNPTRSTIRTVPSQDAQATAEAARAIYTEFNRNLQMAKLSISKEAPLLKILDEATYPLSRKVPDKNQKGMIGSILFIFLGVSGLSVIYIFKEIMKEAE